MTPSNIYQLMSQPRGREHGVGLYDCAGGLDRQSYFFVFGSAQKRNYTQILWQLALFMGYVQTPVAFGWLAAQQQDSPNWPQTSKRAQRAT